MATQTKKKTSSKGKVNKAKVKELAEKGVSSTDIAKTQGVSRQYIDQILKKYGVEKQELEDFKGVQGDLLVNLQKLSIEKRVAILNSMPNEEIEAMTNHEKRALYHTLATCQGIDFDKLRLLQGQSTQNTQALLVMVQGGVQEQSHRALQGSPLKQDGEDG